MTTNPISGNTTPSIPGGLQWRAFPSIASYYTAVPHHPPVKTLVLAAVLFLLTFCSCLVAGAQFAAAYANNQAVSLDEFIRAWPLLYRHPTALLRGLPFSLTLLTILLAHELGHFFACRKHRIYASYPFFIPFPSFIGTFGAFILVRSPFRTNRALFDVGASGPFAGFLLAFPALLYGVLHAKIVPNLTSLEHADIVFGVPAILHLLSAIIHPGVSAGTLLLPPVGRAAWIGLFATALNLLPVGQLDGGHILRSVSPRGHRLLSFFLPVFLVLLGFFRHWSGWYIWAVILLGLRFFRSVPIYDPMPLDPRRRFGAFLALVVFLLCFMAAPILSQ